MGKDVKSPLVEVKNLKMYFNIPHKGTLHAVDDVSFSIYSGETLGLVGESGCGKSTVGNVFMRLLKATSGQLLYENADVFKPSIRSKEGKGYCKKMQIIFQDPYSSLNPRKTVRKILSEPYVVQHRGNSGKIDELVTDLCERVDIPLNLLDCYPHELDGGMRQVIGIARALSLNPRLIVCDEPVSSLDVSVQAKIINLLMDIQKEYGLSYLFISHDLSVVRHISDRIAVMYLGQIVEICDTDTIFEHTLHPYSIALLSAVPKVRVDKKVTRIILQGDVPSPMNPKQGCRFALRCWMSQERCFSESPELREVEAGHCVACHYWDISRENMKVAATTSLNKRDEERYTNGV